MNEAEIEQLRQKLLNLRAELLALEEDQPAELEQAGAGGLSRREAMQAQKTAEEGVRKRKRQLQKIDGALRRIAASEFGRCFICEEEISAAALFADPTTTRCGDCAEE